MTKINYSAPVNGMGYGVAAVNLLVALEHAGAEPALFPVGPVEAMDHHAPYVRQGMARAEHFHIDGASLRLNHEWLMAESVGRGPRLGYTFFEIDRLPPRSVHSLNSLDAVFVASPWAAEVVLASGVRGAARVVVATPGVDRAVFHPGVVPAPLEKPTVNTTVFLHMGKWCLNKGQDFLLEAFNAAFTPADDVLLVVASFNPLKFANYDGPAESAKWAAMFMDSPMGRAGKVRVVPGRLPTQHDVARLMAAADCGFFPARAEGFNLELAEMCAMGRHAVATDYSAHTAFARDAGVRLIHAAGREPAYDGVFFDGTASWARLGADQLEQSAWHLRDVHREKQEGRLGANRAGVEAFRSRFTWEKCAATVLEHAGA